MTLSIADFQSKQEQQDTAPTFNYTIKLKDGSVHNERGYFVINSLFAAVCRGDEGVIYWAVPTEQFASVVNNGPVSSSLN
jgi:hypothetical protein